MKQLEKALNHESEVWVKEAGVPQPVQWPGPVATFDLSTTAVLSSVHQHAGLHPMHPQRTMPRGQAESRSAGETGKQLATKAAAM